MYDVSCILLSYTYKSDKIGNQIVDETIETVIPIRVGEVGLKEFYEAGVQNLRPDLKLITSSLNYDGQTELLYMGEKYTIIRKTLNNSRMQSTTYDEINLICEKRLGDV